MESELVVVVVRAVGELELVLLEVIWGTGKAAAVGAVDRLLAAVEVGAGLVVGLVVDEIEVTLEEGGGKSWFQVAGPTMPSADNPATVWNRETAIAVLSP